MFKILIIEDDITIHDCIKELLEKENYLVYSAYSGTEAMLLLEKEKIDLLLLDLMLPAINGEEIIKAITNIPIIVISAKISEEDKVKCLKLGANDYITKPFSNKELIARIEVQLRQKYKTYTTNNLKYDDLELLDDGHTLIISNKKINLTKTEYAIIKQLLLRSAQVISKSKLLDLINDVTEDCDENSLKVHISNIRKKMKKVSNKNYIESVWGIGFKLFDKKLTIS